MKKIKALLSGLAIVSMGLLSGCDALVYPNDKMIVANKKLVKDGMFDYKININASRCITVRTTNQFCVGEELIFTSR